MSATTACSFSYEDADGTRHVIGLVDMEIRPADKDAAVAGNVIDITSIGIGYHAAADSASFSVGYSRSVTAALRNDVLVLGNPLAAHQWDRPERIEVENDHE